MASTPPPFPLRTPPTPLHGAKYTHPREYPLPSRKSRRIAAEEKTTPRHRTPSPGPSLSKQPALRQSPRLLSKLEGRNSVGAGSLLTPVKTPKKKETTPTTSTARVLFSSTKTSSKSSSDLLQASTAVTSESITIFEDSNARIPRHDPSDDNPFGRSSQPSRKKCKTQTVDVPEGEQPSEKGMWTVFRGRRIWKDFRDIDTRQTKIQPRLLFDEEVEEQNEEEDTDIESSPIPGDDDNNLEFEASADKAKVGKVTRSRDLDAEEHEPAQEVVEAEQTVEELRQKRVARFVDVDVVEPAKNRLKTPEPSGPSHAGPMTPPSTVQKRKRPLEPDSAQKPMRSTGLFTPHRTPHRTPNKKRKIDEQASLRRAGRRTQV